MDNNDPALAAAQPSETTAPLPENSFSFAPVNALRAVPHLWDRKPSTPFRAAPKPRKLWKRFHSSFSSMMPLRFSAATNGPQEAGYVRGVKRLCLASGNGEYGTDGELEQRGLSFLETKWASEAQKRRKLPNAPMAIHDENLQSVGIQKETAICASPQPLSTLQGLVKTPIYNDSTDVENLHPAGSDAKATEDQQSGLSSPKQGTMRDNAEGRNDMTSSTTDAVQNLTQEQEGTLVRSALRSSLDGEDAELLNEFLSKAKAKRAAKAALINAQDADDEKLSSSTEESPETECSTPRSRRALEDLDTNSPSPVKAQVSPSKGDAVPDADTGEELVSKEAPNNEPAPTSPPCRRSTRVKAPPPANGPSARNTISLRRAKGTEFVFLQRTEAQELALATKRNTRHNKGNAVLPKYALETLAQQQRDDATDKNDQQARSDRKSPGSRRTAPSGKSVAWNEKRLVEFDDAKDALDDQAEEEEGNNSKNDGGCASRLRSGGKRSEKKTAASSRSSRSQTLQKEDEESAIAGTDGGSTAGTTASTSATPRSRRVRRLGDSGMASGTPVKTGNGRGTSKPPATSSAEPTAADAGLSTPPKGRRKLTPKPPRSSLLPAPVSKSSNVSAAEQPFVSGIPTRSTKTSEATKRKSMLQVSAGSTPMPRRVRTKT